jgi:hypothetical protein
MKADGMREITNPLWSYASKSTKRAGEIFSEGGEARAEKNAGRCTNQNQDQAPNLAENLSRDATNREQRCKEEIA